MTITYRVQSTSAKTGRKTTLDPKFLDRKAAETFMGRLNAKWGEIYLYAIVSDAPADPEGDAAWRELGIDPQIARQSRQVAPGATLAPSVAPEASQDADAPWEPSQDEIRRHQAEIREIERREWKRFEGLDLNAKATPAYGEVFEDGGCRRCARTGQFITGSLNGQPTGPGGECFKCQGKGYQTLGDCKRNGYWERHQRVSL